MPAADRSPVFVFIDESGNFDFSERGTGHFVLSAFVTRSPINCSKLLHELTYEYLANERSGQIPFHATENSTSTRHDVLERLCGHEHTCQVLTVWADKSRLPQKDRSAIGLYSRLASALASALLAEGSPNDSQWVLLFDKALTNRQQAPMIKSVRRKLAQFDVNVTIKFRPVSHDVNGQIADYYAWSVFRKLERSDASWFELLPGRHAITNLD